MQANIKLGRIFGIEVGLHYSWLIIALLVTLSLTEQFRATNPQWGAGVIWATAIATALLFFASIVAHELSHAAVAKANGLPAKAITLFALGGVAQIEKEAEDARTEFWMGIVGPIASAVIGFACLGLTMALGWTPAVAPETPLRAMLMWLGVINIVIAIFNMIPGYPLDGGRVLRAIVWWVTGDVVDSRDNLQTFVDEHLLRTGHRCFVVEEQGRISGIITPHELKGVERTRWPYTTVDAVMLPLERLHTVDPHTLVTEALEVMGREDVNQLPVVLKGSVAGIITRGDVLRLLQTRAELQTMRSG